MDDEHAVSDDYPAEGAILYQELAREFFLTTPWEDADRDKYQRVALRLGIDRHEWRKRMKDAIPSLGTDKHPLA